MVQSTEPAIAQEDDLDAHGTPGNERSWDAVPAWETPPGWDGAPDPVFPDDFATPDDDAARTDRPSAVRKVLHAIACLLMTLAMVTLVAHVPLKATQDMSAEPAAAAMTTMTVPADAPDAPDMEPTDDVLAKRMGTAALDGTFRFDLTDMGWNREEACRELRRFQNSPARLTPEGLAYFDSFAICEEPGADGMHIRVEVGLDRDAAEVATRVEAVHERAGQIASSIPAGLTERQALWCLLVVLSDSVEYECSETSEDPTAYSALITGKANCIGISRAYAECCRAYGIDCNVVGGTAIDDGQEGGHAWNMVVLDGRELYMDVTWSRPHASGISHDWFLLDAREMAAKGHILSHQDA